MPGVEGDRLGSGVRARVGVDRGLLVIQGEVGTGYAMVVQISSEVVDMNCLWMSWWYLPHGGEGDGDAWHEGGGGDRQWWVGGGWDGGMCGCGAGN